jgi:hypothetical protein
MGLLCKLLKTTIDVVTLPIDVVKDITTLGGILTDENKPYTSQKFEKLNDDLEGLSDEIDEL